MTACSERKQTGSVVGVTVVVLVVVAVCFALVDQDTLLVKVAVEVETTSKVGGETFVCLLPAQSTE